ALFTLVPALAFASSTGISGYSGKNASTCNSCHTGGAAPMVTLNGPSTLVASATGTYTVTITGGAATKAGFDASVSSAGAVLQQGGANTRIYSGEATHM